MADGYNEVRAMRLAEIVQDFRNLQHYIAQINAYPTAEEYNGQGYALLRQCASEGQAVLQAPFAASQQTPDGDEEQEKAHLKYVILDASARRLQAHKIYLKATAAMRWINSRNAVLQSSGSASTRQSQMQQIQATLQSELQRITDDNIVTSLRNSDHQQGRWIHEDPTATQIRQYVTRATAAANAARQASGGTSSSASSSSASSGGRSKAPAGRRR